MNLLVTGGAGFIGSNFIHYWLENNPDDRIVNLDALTYAGNLENLKAAENNPNYRFVRGNICDEELVDRILKDEQIELIVHFAAESHVDRSIENSQDFVRTNVEGTRVLLDCAKNNGRIRFHHISTDEVFGELGPNEPPFSESTPYDPQSPYSASKAGADHLARAYFNTHDLPVTISNCSNNYGPFQFPEKLIPRFVTNLILGKKVPVYGKGENVRDWIFVDDHNRGVGMIIKKGKIGRTYCLGGGHELKNIEITRKLLKLMGRDESCIEYVPDRAGHDFRYAVDYSRAKKELGWEPEVDFEEGLKRTVEWYEGNRGWWERLLV